VIGFLDAAAGASGDMLLGALVDAGVPPEHLASTVGAVAPERIELAVEAVSRHGIGATRVRVTTSEPVAHRTLPEIRRLLAEAPLPIAVRSAAQRTFDVLAQAEARVHRIEPEQVHFHEVGALDAIADVVGTCAAVNWLTVHRGLSMLYCGPIEVGGSGSGRSAHGAIPVPAPAVLEILRAADRPLTARLPHEACTPTGAALLAVLTKDSGPLPPMRVRAVGTGAGARDPAEVANLVRLILGEPTDGAAHEAAVVLECNVDDLDPRLWPSVLDSLLTAGASDAWLTPILMKKGRPAHTLRVLCRPALAGVLRSLVVRQTSSIGLRQYPVDKYPLERTTSTVDVDGQPVRVKLASLSGELVNVAVEYDDVLAAAQALATPAKLVLARASAAAQKLRSDLGEEGQRTDDP
jgi:uncharacterized protein (TIGR00299 family) protein